MSERPYIICHMIMTVDGKILTRRWRKHIESSLTSKFYDSCAAEFDVGSWLVGTTTMKELTGDDRAIRAPKEQIPDGDFIANQKAETFAIGTDTNGVLRFDEDNVGGDQAIVITSETVSAAYRAHLRKVGVSYVLCGRDKINLKLAMKKLRQEFKLDKILLEGGGIINGAMLSAGLVDEISQVIVPVVDGGGPSVTGFFDLQGKAPAHAAAALRLIEQRTLKGGTQWLRYKVR
jgi:2,5-diamino-6-(ribosylamino)-4(3H)-pyrimidinone 5'-phosphate reductase